MEGTQRYRERTNCEIIAKNDSELANKCYRKWQKLGHGRVTSKATSKRPMMNCVEVEKSECLLVQDLIPQALRAKTRNPLMLSLCVKNSDSDVNY
jgi:hypothetical protein